EGGCGGRGVWTRPKPPTRVRQARASITTLRCVRRLSASAEKLFMTCSPKDAPVISRSEPAESSRHIENYSTRNHELCVIPMANYSVYLGPCWCPNESKAAKR